MCDTSLQNIIKHNKQNYNDILDNCIKIRESLDQRIEEYQTKKISLNIEQIKALSYIQYDLLTSVTALLKQSLKKDK